MNTQELNGSVLINLSEHIPRITYFFPQDSGLKPVDVRGFLPVEGQKVIVYTYDRSEDSGYCHNCEEKNRYWEVKKIYHIINPTVDMEHAARRVINGLPQNSYRAEVYLEPSSLD